MRERPFIPILLCALATGGVGYVFDTLDFLWIIFVAFLLIGGTSMILYNPE